jgi:hypothetical protein
MSGTTYIGHGHASHESSMPGKLFFAGVAIYLASFLLPAVGDNIPTAHPIAGYYCAWFSLTYPWGRNSESLLPNQYLSLLASGWINSAFLAATVLQLYSHRSVLALAFRFVTIALIPSCWLFFYYQRMHPREGHILWIIGMLVVLFDTPSLTLRSGRDA